MIIFNDKLMFACVVGKKHKGTERKTLSKISNEIYKNNDRDVDDDQLANCTKNTKNYLSHHKYKTKCNVVNRRKQQHQKKNRNETEKNKMKTKTSVTHKRRNNIN